MRRTASTVHAPPRHRGPARAEREVALFDALYAFFQALWRAGRWVRGRLGMTEPSGRRTWLDSWSGSGGSPSAWHARAFDLQLARYDARGWPETSAQRGWSTRPRARPGLDEEPERHGTRRSGRRGRRLTTPRGKSGNQRTVIVTLTRSTVHLPDNHLRPRKLRSPGLPGHFDAGISSTHN